MSPSIQPAFAQTVLPDDIVFVDGPAVLESGGTGYVIDIQLTLRGANYSGNNFGIYFRSSDSSLVDIPGGSSVVSDTNGRASFNFSTGQGYGNVTITASLLSPDGSVRASKTYRVTASGNVSGTVVEASGKRIPGATITLYSLENGVKGSAVPLEGNPVTATDQGAYALDSVPYGDYLVEAVMDGQNGSAGLTVSSADQSLAIVIPGYVAPVPTATPTTEPTAAPTEQPSPTITPAPGSPTPAPKTPTGDTTRQLVWILAIALVLTAIIVGVQWVRQKGPKK